MTTSRWTRVAVVWSLVILLHQIVTYKTQYYKFGMYRVTMMNQSSEFVDVQV
jgi:hypothetical protein